MKNSVFIVRGMFCSNCEKRIEGALERLSGIEKAKASFTRGTVDVSWDPGTVSAEKISQCIEAEGYQVAKSALNIQTVSLVLILVALYVIADHLGWTGVLNIFPRVETSVSLGMLFVIGLLTSVHCIAMCGGINLTQSTMAAGRSAGIARSNILYNTGRVISYTVIGALAGALGSVLSFGGSLKGVVVIVAGALMLVMALNMLGVFLPLRRLNIHLPAGLHRRLVSGSGGRSSLIIGLLNGLMPCGPLQTMQIYALSTGGVLLGALSMLLFSLGTVPLMFGFGFFAGKLNRKHARYMLTVSAFIILLMGMHMIGNGLSLSGVSIIPQRAQQGKTAMLSDDVQIIETEVDYGSYEPFTVRAGIPVQWTITVPEGKLNGCNGEIIVPQYGLDIVLKEGSTMVTFTPLETGTVPYSCWMGMIKSTITVI